MLLKYEISIYYFSKNLQIGCKDLFLLSEVTFFSECSHENNFSFFSLFNFLYAVPFSLNEVDSAYKDYELDALWNSIKDINKPSLKDFQAVEKYLKYGERPYLDEIFNLPYLIRTRLEYNQMEFDRSYDYYNRILQRLRLVGVNNEMPVFERLALGGTSKNDLSRCIVFYVSYNESPHAFDKDAIYSEKMLEIVKELQMEGYKGHVLFRIGGYPLIDRGGLRLAHVPYSFKILALIEASILGYENVIWLDSTVHPTNDLEKVFSELVKSGTFLVGGGPTLNYENEYGIISNVSLKYSSLTVADLFDVDSLSAAIIGISFVNKGGHDLIREWYRLTADVYPAMTLIPEQFLLSIAAWRTKQKKVGDFGSLVFRRSLTPTRPTRNYDKSFWFDKG